MKRVSTCQCGNVVFEAVGEPIVSAVCYCVDCQAAAEKIKSAFPNAIVTEPDGGSAYSTFKDAQWHCIKGAELLRGIKLNETSPTTRYVAECCQSPLYLKYRHGFWLSAYRHQFKDALPPLEWRNKVNSRQSDLPFPDDIPRFKGFPMRLFWRLAKAKFGRKPRRQG